MKSYRTYRLIQLTIILVIMLSGASCRKNDPANARKAMRDTAINTNKELLKIERIAIVCGAPDDVSDADCMDDISYHAAIGLSERAAKEGLRRLIDEKMKSSAKPVKVVRIVRVSERGQLGQVKDSVDALIYVCVEDLRVISHDSNAGWHNIKYAQACKGWLRKPTDDEPLALSCEKSGEVDMKNLDKSALPEDEEEVVNQVASWVGRDLLGDLVKGVGMIRDAGTSD